MRKKLKEIDSNKAGVFSISVNEAVEHVQEIMESNI
jgi:hypothetical protein